MDQNTDQALTSALADLRANRFKQGARKFRDLVEHEPNNAMAFTGLADALTSLKRYDRALPLAAKAVELDPTLSKAHSVLGYVYLKLRRWSDSEGELKRAIELDPNAVHARVNLAHIYAVYGQREQAVPLLLQALDINPNLWVIYLGLAMLYNQMNRWSDARAPALRAFRLKRNLETWQTLLLAYLGRYEPLSLLLLVILAGMGLAERSAAGLLAMLLIASYFSWLTVLSFRSGRRLFFAVGLLLTLLFVFASVKNLLGY